MTYLLDTNTCIRYLNGTSDSVRQHMAQAQPQDLLLCSVVKAMIVALVGEPQTGEARASSNACSGSWVRLSS